MRKIFQKWLFLFVAAAFAVTFVLSFSIQTQQARLNAVGLIRLKIDDARKQIEANRRNVAAIRELTDAAARAKARALAEMIALKPGLLEDRSELEKVRLRLDADELHVSDEKGILIASIPSIYEGYDMASAAQSAAFLPALTNPAFVLVQDPQRKGADGEVFQYAGVARADRPGIVQIGYQPKRLQEAMDIAAIENLSAGFRIGKAGRILIVRDGRIVSIDDQTFLGRPVQDYGLEPARLEAGGAFAAAIGGRRCIGVTGRHRDFIIVGLLPQEEMYLGRNEMGMFLVTGNVILFAVVFVLVSYLVQRVVIDGIYSVNRSLEKITRGDLSERVEVKTNAEFVLLSEGINSTVAALKKAIAEAAARIDAELQLARAIQRSSLPHVFAAPPGRSNYTIHAVMHAAREVGGDFYDFFPVGAGQLAVVIADVSGKGIPAAMFMMTAKALIRSHADSGIPPASVFAEANDRLCENNETSMFVTAFLSVLDLKTGALACVNAGHNPPLIQRAGGRCEWLRIQPGFVLGGMEGMRYRQERVILAPGDRLFLYTDGVTEALNPARALYSEARLEALLNAEPAPRLGAAELLEHVKADLDRFAAGAEQADDITMLALEYQGPEPT